MLENLMIDYIKPTITWLHFHPYFTYFATFLIAFSESLAFIGLILPGGLLLIGIGTLIGSGIINPYETIISAILGALVGDFLSFWVGHHYRKHLYSVWPFCRWPKILQAGEDFFCRHGGKSIFLGRFIGPLRPITPIIAGIMKMPILPFAVIDIISAILWAIVYMLSGVILGSAASVELSPDALPHFFLIIFIAIFSLTAIYWILHKVTAFFVAYYHHFQHACWRTIQRTPSLTFIKKLVHTPHMVDREHQIDLLFLLLFSILLFTFTTYQVITHGFLTHYDVAINYFFRSLRTDTLDKIFIPITFLAEKRPIGVLIIVMTVLLLWRRYFLTAFYWILNTALVFGIAGLTKTLLHVHRPLGTRGVLEHGWSYPSGHCALSIAILGLLIIFLAQDLPRLARKYIYIFTFVFVTLVALSRLYLGVHWFSDVLGGLSLGLVCMSFTALLYRHKKAHLHPLPLIAFITFLSWLIAWSVLYIHDRTKAFNDYQLTWTKETLSINEWWQQDNDNKDSPLYRHNRFGKPIQTLNIQLVGNNNVLKEILLKQGWSVLNKNAIKILFNRISDLDNTAQLPIITQQYLEKAPALIMYKTVNTNHLLILRLWTSAIEITPTTSPTLKHQTLLAGEVNYYHAWHPKLLGKNHLASTPPESALNILLKDIQHNSKLQYKMAHFEEYPPLNNTLDQNWNGLVLLIKTR